MTRAESPLIAAHLLGNALLLWLGYYWLSIGESDASHLVTSALVLSLFTLGALWLHAIALAQFSRERSFTFPGAAWAAGRNLLPLLCLALVTGALYALLAYWHGKFGHNTFVISSWLTMTIRKPVAPERVLRVFHFLIWLLRWLIIPVIVLPLAARVVTNGWNGLRFSSLWRSKQILYWAEVCILLLCAFWVPFKLFNWIPKVNTFTLELVSFMARFGLAYLLFVAALLALEFFTSAGRPRASQPNTEVSP